MADYYSIHQASKMLNLSAQTLRNWDRSGYMKPHHTSTNGRRYYSKEQLNAFLNVKSDTARVAIGYCRVSSKKQFDDLERQVENMKTYLTAQGQPFEIITDIGSGINYQKKGLRQLIEKITKGEVCKIVVLYKDRLLRFGFELIEYIASLYDCQIEVINSIDKTEQQELVEDLVQIVTVFSCRLQGKRQKRTKELLTALVKDGESDA